MVVDFEGEKSLSGIGNEIGDEGSDWRGKSGVEEV